MAFPACLDDLACVSSQDKNHPLAAAMGNKINNQLAFIISFSDLTQRLMEREKLIESSINFLKQLLLFVMPV